MNKVLRNEILLTICVSYTLISLGATIINMLVGSETNNMNTISMLVFTSIAVLVLYTHQIFDKVSPLVMIMIQYVIAMGLVLLYVFIVGLFDPVAEGGYWDIFVSFTIPYVIGAIVYYISVFYQAHKQDALLQEIKKATDCK
ncbi:MAG: hypothetical protein IJC02_11625 [Lachnospiraceae bacterium]|nr:hypothetical protein [Lachnospiraceae bacterium]